MRLSFKGVNNVEENVLEHKHEIHANLAGEKDSSYKKVSLF